MRFVVTRREALDLADGINAFIYSLSNALVRHGDEVFLMTPSRSSEELVSERFGSPSFTGLHSLSDANKPSHVEMVSAWLKKGIPLLRHLNPDFIIVNGGLPLRLPYPSCIVSHDLERRGPYGSLMRQAYKAYAYRKADYIVATCSELKQALAKEIFVPAKNIAVIPTCIDVGSYYSKTRQARDPAILHIGTSEWKNPTATIDAFALLKQPAELYIAGNSTPQLEKRLASLPGKTRERVSLLGIVDSTRLKELLSTVRVLSVPSIYAAPVASPTVLDGLASGTPVVGSTSISTDLLTDDDTGFRSDPGDTRKLANKFELLLHNDELWEAISKNCRKRSEVFSNDSVMRKFRDLAASHVRIAPAGINAL